MVPGFRRSLAALLCALLCGPAPLLAQAPPPPPEQAPPVIPDPILLPPPREEEPLPPPRLSVERRYDLLIAGVGLTLGMWAADRLAARDLATSWSWQPWLPVVGPWFLLNDQLRPTSPNYFTTALVVADGLGQAAGVVMAVLGMVLHKRRMVLSLPPAHAVTFAPAPRPGLAGLAISF